MIFATVGTHYQGFDRLVKKLDEIAAEIGEEVVIQIGFSQYKPRHARYFDFAPYSDVEELNRKARAVVCHDGAGAIITAVTCGKLPIVVPRRKEFGEHSYRTEAPLARELAREGLITLVENVDELEETLKTTTGLAVGFAPKRDSLVGKLREYIRQSDTKSKYGVDDGR